MIAELPGRIGRYEIDRRIGAGGMALTYRCRLEGLGGFSKKVVIKVLHPDHFGDETYVQMFLDEARLSARLHHSNVAQVFEVGDDHGIPYMVMEFVNGPNLASVSRRIGRFGERPYGLMAHMLAAVARGLDHAHKLTGDDGAKLGIVHRDVSLGNIVVARSGVAKLIDFGIAKWKDKNNVTEVGLLKGKLHYMAPEQMSGVTDHRVDIYQLGVCLYWMSTGRPPCHDSDPARVWQMRLAGEITPPTQLVANYPAALEEIVLTALATDPEDRWQSAAELADMLEAFCFSHPAHAASDDAVSQWVQGLVPREEFEDPSSRVINTTGSRRSLGELVQEKTSGTIRSPEAIDLEDDGAEPTIRPGLQTSTPMWVAVVVTAVSTASLAALLALAVIWGITTGTQADRAARVYLDEASRLVAAGEHEAALHLVRRADAAEPQDPEVVVDLLRLQRELGLPVE